ncbi:hypothetical protein HMI55_005595 [Coelomomyces lativittatus]|nr:hypothetical protein HMI56_004500 [Coelomomyces lativittatus]KAJ1517847.1 hypothetical protein HMI55_005595 [Coelomomyces lativittatus]
MPAIHVDQEYIFDYLGKRYTTEEFRELCFEFGIELEEETSEYEMAVDQIGEAAAKGKGLSHRRLYKIDVPANRYDLLCREGIAQALKIFLGLATLPTYQLVPPKDGKFETIFVQKEVRSFLFLKRSKNRRIFKK